MFTHEESHGSPQSNRPPNHYESQRDIRWNRYERVVRQQARDYAQLFFDPISNVKPTPDQIKDFVEQCRTISNNTLSTAELKALGVDRILTDYWDLIALQSKEEHDTISDQSAREAFGIIHGTVGDATLLHEHNKGFHDARKKLMQQRLSLRERATKRLEDLASALTGFRYEKTVTTETDEQRYQFLEQEFPILMEFLEGTYTEDVSTQLEKILGALQEENTNNHTHDPIAWNRLAGFLFVHLQYRLDKIRRLAKTKNDKKDERLPDLSSTETREQILRSSIENSRRELESRLENTAQATIFFQGLQIYRSSLSSEQKDDQFLEIARSLSLVHKESMRSALTSLEPRMLRALAGTDNLAGFEQKILELEEDCEYLRNNPQPFQKDKMPTAYILANQTQAVFFLRKIAQAISRLRSTHIRVSDQVGTTLNDYLPGQTMQETIDFASDKLIPLWQKELRSFDSEARFLKARQVYAFYDEQASLDALVANPERFFKRLEQLPRALQNSPLFDKKGLALNALTTLEIMSQAKKIA